MTKAILHVAPEAAPSQMALPEAARDIRWARARGAVWSPGNGGMTVGPASSEAEASSLMARFTGRAARLRADAAREELGPRPDWRVMARAANQEVISRGEEPVRRVPDTGLAREDRLYLFSIPDLNSPYSTAALDAGAKNAGVTLYRDDSASFPGMGKGLRYVDAREVLPSALHEFAGAGARAARKEFQSGRAGMFARLARAAGLVVSEVTDIDLSAEAEPRQRADQRAPRRSASDLTK